jgi:hypothetical protein
MSHECSYLRVVIRDINENDRAFVCDAFWRSSKQSRQMQDIKKIVSDNFCKVAVLPDSDITILSFVIYSKDNEIIFRYTKQAFRLLGINKKIVNKVKYEIQNT